MSALFVIPGLISLYLVLRGRSDVAFLSVCLPSLLCIPIDYYVRFPHLPPTSVAQFAIIPLGVHGLIRLIRRRSYVLMDLFILCYVASISLSEVLHAPILNDGIFSAISNFISIFLPYAIGRALIEPGLRLATVRRIVTLVLLDALPGIYEWKMGQSLYAMVGQKIFGVAGELVGVQMRNGHGRMGAVFEGGEPGGIAFGMIFCLNGWLVSLARTKTGIKAKDVLSRLERYQLPALCLLACVFLTGSRGPLIGLAAGFLVLQIPRFKRFRVMTFAVAVLLVAGYFAAQAHFASYQNLDLGSLSESQSSAVYRVAMNKLYPPIADRGGWTGYGVLGIPYLNGMTSIDNHYLLVRLAWGRLGYLSLVLILWENIRVLLVRSWQCDTLTDRAFMFSMLAAMAVLWVTLMTVFLGGQLPEISSLLIGWIQSIDPKKGSVESAEVPRPAVQFLFRRVFT